MVDATSPVLLGGLFQVHTKHCNRALTLIQQLCISSCHIAICYNRKTKQTSVLKIINFKKGVGIQVIKSCETSYLCVVIANGKALWESLHWHTITGI